MTERVSIERQVALKAAVELVKAILDADKALPGGGKDAVLVTVRAADEFAKWISAGQGFVSPDRAPLRKDEAQPADRPEGDGGMGKAVASSGHTHSWIPATDKRFEKCAECGKARRKEEQRDDSAEVGSRGQA
jgi:hypothetical protein